jgi:hypothetical protein
MNHQSYKHQTDKRFADFLLWRGSEKQEVLLSREEVLLSRGIVIQFESTELRYCASL